MTTYPTVATFVVDSALQKEADSARLCIAFHSEWMKRAPDETLERHALRRRESFPVAVVVVVHDDISLMRATLEEVAMVVEFVVSVPTAVARVGHAPSEFTFCGQARARGLPPTYC